MFGVLFAGVLAVGTPSQGVQNRTTENTVRARYVGQVSGGYLRMNHADSLLALAAAVRKGEMPATVLDGLIGPKTQAALLRAPNLAFPRPTTTIQAPRPSVERGPRAMTPKVRPELSPWALAAQAAGLNHLLPEFSPDSLRFSPLSDGRREDRLLLLTSPTDGPINLKLPLKEKNFRILELRLYGGKITNRLLSSGARWPGPVFERRAQAPWRVVASSGQQVGIVVRFEPKLNIITNGAGPKSSVLTIDGSHWNAQKPKQPPWHLDIPLSGKFLGLVPGVIGFPEVGNIDVVTPDSYRPQEPHSFSASVVLINAKEAVSGTIRPLSLPPGVRMNSFAVSLPKGSTRTVQVPLSIDRSDLSGPWGLREVPFEIQLEGKFGSRSFSMGFSLTVYPSTHVWDFHDVDVGSCTVAGTFTMYGSGRFTFGGVADNHDIAVGREVHFRGGFDGSTNHVNLVLNPPGNGVDYKTYGFVRTEFGAHFLRYVGLPLPVQVTVKYP